MQLEDLLPADIKDDLTCRRYRKCGADGKVLVTWKRDDNAVWFIEQIDEQVLLNLQKESK